MSTKLPQHIQLNPDGFYEARYLISGLNCGGCVSQCEKLIQGIGGVSRVSVRFDSGECFITFNQDQLTELDLIKTVAEFGYQLKPYLFNAQLISLESEEKDLLSRLAVAGITMMQVGMLSLALYFGDYYGMKDTTQIALSYIATLITAIAIAYSGQSFFKGCWRGLKNKRLTMDTTLSMALILAFALGLINILEGHTESYFESVLMLMFLILLSRFIEMKVRQKNLIDLQRSFSNAQKTAQLIRISENGEEKYELVSDDQINVGDLIFVSSGDRVPADLMLIEEIGDPSGINYVALDESAFTGESRFVRKALGDIILQGSFNKACGFKARVTAVGDDTRLANINRIANDARMDKAKIVQESDRLASQFLGVLLCLCLLAAVYWSLVDASRIAEIILTLLIAACPCALSIATPTAISASVLSMRKNGILFNQADVVEKLKQVNHIVFDKTGTLTQLRMSVDNLRVNDRFETQDVIDIIVALEAGINHPIAKSLSSLSVSKYPALENRKVYPGQGLSAEVEGKEYFIGSKPYVEAMVGEDILNDVVVKKDGGLAVYLVTEDLCLANIELRESLTKGVRQLLDELKNNYDFSYTILSGDSSERVKRVAEDLGITHYYGGQSAEGKLEIIAGLENSGARVLMVGDGNNDFPAQSKSFLSIALPQSPDLSKVDADIILLENNMFKIKSLFSVNDFTHKILHQGFSSSLAYNGIALVLAFAGFLNPLTAALGMSLSSILVVSNTLRINRFSSENLTTESNNSGLNIKAGYSI